MEYHLLNSYLKYQKELKPSFFRALKKIPISIEILLMVATISLATSFIILFTAGANMWFYILTVAEVVSAGWLYYAQERWQIKHSQQRYDDFRKSAIDLYEWLRKYSITQKDDIELIRMRLTRDLEKQEELKKQQEDKRDRWMQTLVIPLILAIITAVVSNQTDITTVLGYVFSLLAVWGLICAFAWIIRSVFGILNDRKRNSIKCFVDALQDVLDVVFVFCLSDSADTDPSKNDVHQ